MNAQPPPAGPSDGDPARRITAFQGSRRIAAGAQADILSAIAAARRRDPQAPLLVFDDATGQLVELDLRDQAGGLAGKQGEGISARQAAGAGNAAEDLANAADRRRPRPDGRREGHGKPLAPVVGRGVGRPKLGVVAREVTLLPRHWEWLSRQPGGASVTLRKLVEEARRSGAGRDRVRNAQEVTYRFLLAIAGNLPGYEEAMRALFASRREAFEELLAGWPADIRDHALRLAAEAFPIDG